MLSTYHPEDANRGDDYPDVDQVRFFIETKELNPLKRKIQYLAQLERELGEVRPALQTGLNAFNSGDTRYHLETVPAPRYWQPTEPVILMKGEGIERTERHGQDGRLSEDDTLPCPVLPLSKNLKALFNRTARVGTDFSQEIVSALRQESKDSFAFGTWTQNPWNPIMLEWEVELLPVKSKTNQAGTGYAVDVITDNYELYDHAIDLEINPNQRELARGSFYSNRCILSSHSSGELKQRIEAYLQKNLFDTYYEYQINESATEGVGLEIRNWYEGQGPQFSKPTKWYTDNKFLDIDSIKTWYESKPTFPKGSTAKDKDKQAQDPI